MNNIKQLKSYDEEFMDKYGKVFEVRVQFEGTPRPYTYLSFGNFDPGTRALVPAREENLLKTVTVLSSTEVPNVPGDKLRGRKWVFRALSTMQTECHSLTQLRETFGKQYDAQVKKEKEVKAAEAKFKLREARLKTAMSEARTKAGDYLQDKEYSFQDIELRVLGLKEKSGPIYNPVKYTDGNMTCAVPKEIKAPTIEDIKAIVGMIKALEALAILK